MKIEKGYALSQFIDIVKMNGIGLESESLDNIIDYNELLKQPLTKEMFVNEKSQVKFELNHGSKKAADIVIGEIQKEWEEGEEKVIFDGCKRGWSESWLDVYEIGSLEICHNIGQDKWHFAADEIELKTLHDLFEATNGQLTLKNVTI